MLYWTDEIEKLLVNSKGKSKNFVLLSPDSFPNLRWTPSKTREPPLALVLRLTREINKNAAAGWRQMSGE
jgi:hypothetical protein